MWAGFLRYHRATGRHQKHCRFLADHQITTAAYTFERPKKYNTLTYEVISEMQRVLELIANDQSVNVLVIASRGKSFCTGHDMKEMNAKRDEKFYQDLLFECSKMIENTMEIQ